MWQYNYSNELYHHGVKGMKWGVKKKRQTASITKSNRNSAEKKFNAVKKGINAYLDKKDRENFFNSDSIFSEKSMKQQSRIDRARDFINDLDYKTLTSDKGRKHLAKLGKQFIEDSLDDADRRDFFNKDWDTRRDNESKRDVVRDTIKHF